MSRKKCIQWEIIITQLPDLPQRRTLELEHIDECPICWRDRDEKTQKIIQSIHETLDPVTQGSQANPKKA